MRHNESHAITGPWPVKPLSRPRCSRGQSLVEMALIAPVLLLLLFGIIEMGRLFFAWVTVQHAARMGARAGIAGPDDQDNDQLSRIIAEAQKAADSLPAGELKIIVRSGKLTDADVSKDGPGGPCDLVEVQVQYTYQPIAPLKALIELITLNSVNDIEVHLKGIERKVNEPWRPCP